MGDSLNVGLPNFYMNVWYDTIMPHIHTDPGQHDLTASAYIFKKSPEASDYRLLLHMHKKVKKLMQPGGHVELDESPWQSIQHELLEETGYELTQLGLMQPAHLTHIILSNPKVTVHPYPLIMNTHEVNDGHNVHAHNHTDVSYMFFTEQEPLHLPGEDESQDLRWMTKEDIQALTYDEISSVACEVSLAAFAMLESGLWTPTKLDLFN